MSTRYQSVDQVRMLLEQIGIEIHQVLGDQIRKTATEGPEIKRQQYPAEAYQDQIEKNALYLRESTNSLIAATIDYLKNGQPLLNRDQINGFVTYTRITRAQKVTLLHLNYIRYGCSGCDTHEEHTPYAELRQMVQSGDLPRYLEEMEFSYIYYQASSMVAANYLATVLDHHNLAASARAIPTEQLANVVRERVFMRTDGCLGTYQVAASPEVERILQQQMSSQKIKQKRRWQFWK